MPKYTTSTLEFHLKKDAKIIKKSNKSLKTANILNFLSSLLGYKNYQEVTKRENNKNLIELTFLPKDELEEIKLNYFENIKDEYGILQSEYSFSTIKQILRFYYKKDARLKEKRFLDFTEYKTVISLDNYSYQKIMECNNYYLNQEDFEKMGNVKSLLEIIIDMMTYKRIKSIQKEIGNYLDIEILQEYLKALQDKEKQKNLKRILKRLSSNYEKIKLDLLVVLSHPYFDLSDKTKEVVTIDSIKNDPVIFCIACHDKGSNREIFNHLFNFYYMGMFKSKTLPSKYKKALSGFKIQAEAATEMLKNTSGSRDKLNIAHNLISSNKYSSDKIYSLLKKHNLSIDELNENVLFDLLSLNDSLELNHLKKEPSYFLLSKKIDDKEIYFISSYFESDCGCAGQEPSKEEAIKQMDYVLKNEMIKDLIKIEKPMKTYQKLLHQIEKKELIFNIYSN